LLKIIHIYVVIIICVQTHVLPSSKLDPVPVCCVLCGVWLDITPSHQRYIVFVQVILTKF